MHALRRKKDVHEEHALPVDILVKARAVKPREKNFHASPILPLATLPVSPGDLLRLRRRSGPPQPVMERGGGERTRHCQVVRRVLFDNHFICSLGSGYHIDAGLHVYAACAGEDAAAVYGIDITLREHVDEAVAGHTRRRVIAAYGFH